MAQVRPTGICSEERKVQHVADPANNLEIAEYCLKSFHWMEAKLQNRHPTPPTGPLQCSSAHEVDKVIVIDIRYLTKLK